jgi:hypothetical protein
MAIPARSIRPTRLRDAQVVPHPGQTGGASGLSRGHPRSEQAAERGGNVSQHSRRAPDRPLELRMPSHPRVHPASPSGAGSTSPYAGSDPPASSSADDRSGSLGQASGRRGRATRVPDREASRALLRSRPVSAEPSTCARAAAAQAADRLSTFGAGCREAPDRQFGVNGDVPGA